MLWGGTALNLRRGLQLLALGQAFIRKRCYQKGVGRREEWRSIVSDPMHEVQCGLRASFSVKELGEDQTPEQELSDDLLTLIACLSGRLYSMRSHKQKELLKCAQTVINGP